MNNSLTYNDKELFTLISDGDETAFATLYRNYVPQLLPFINGTVRSDAVADEVIQEVFLRLWVSRDKLPAVEEPRAWIFRIAANICYTHVKRLMTERTIIGKLTNDAPNQSGDEVQLQAQANELATLIRKAIDQLPKQRKNIYQLSREKGMSIPEIAESLNLSPSTVKNTLVSSLQSIRTFLEERGYSLPLVIIAILYNFPAGD